MYQQLNRCDHISLATRVLNTVLNQGCFAENGWTFGTFEHKFDIKNIICSNMISFHIRSIESMAMTRCMVNKRDDRLFIIKLPQIVVDQIKSIEI